MTLGIFYQIFPVLFGLGVFVYQQSYLEEFLPGLYDPKEKYLGVGGVDNVLNILVPFFRQYLNDSSSILVNHSVFPLFFVILFIVAVEGSIPGRSIPGVKGLFGHYVLIAALSQLLGASVAIPLIWIPFWIASENHKEIHSHSKRITLNPKRIEKIGLGILLMFPSLVGMSVFKQKTLLDWSIVIYQFLPPLVAIFWAWHPKVVDSSKVTPIGDAYRVASKFSSILFGISLYEWLLVLTYAVDNYFEILFDTLGQLISGITLPSTMFMIVDTWCLIAAATYWVFLAEKASFNKRFWKFVGQSILFGSSGALALYIYHRYSEMVEEGDDATEDNFNSSRLRYTNEPIETQPLL